ncbi:hypothetical protein SDC9_166179 [bioreactor metagenome]|uniref:NTF2 fold domain-containing protein n=1 Tax=bioreactor metagenome TaxID=1076179 RepID=A0A645G3V7_9ZZZZ
MLLSMSSCENQSDASKTAGEYDIVSPSDYNLNVKEGEGAIVRDYVDNAETAQQIADAVIKSIVGEKQFSELIGVHISYDPENGIWLVDRNLGPLVFGGDYLCAIKKSNGEILKVVAGE